MNTTIGVLLAILVYPGALVALLAAEVLGWVRGKTLAVAQRRASHGVGARGHRGADRHAAAGWRAAHPGAAPREPAGARLRRRRVRLRASRARPRDGHAPARR